MGELVIASKEGNLSRVKELLSPTQGYGFFRRTIDPNSRDSFGDTSLIKASRNNHVEVVKVLLEAGALVNIKDNWENTPLKWAAFKGHHEVVDLLIKAKANINIMEAEDRTPLMWASLNGALEVVKLLLKAGALVDLIDLNGNTALMDAASSGVTMIVSELLNANANVYIQNKGGMTALQFAQQGHHEDCIELIEAFILNENQERKEKELQLQLKYQRVDALLIQLKSECEEKQLAAVQELRRLSLSSEDLEYLYSQGVVDGMKSLLDRSNHQLQSNAVCFFLYLMIQACVDSESDRLTDFFSLLSLLIQDSHVLITVTPLCEWISDLADTNQEKAFHILVVPPIMSLLISPIPGLKGKIFKALSKIGINCELAIARLSCGYSVRAVCTDMILEKGLSLNFIEITAGSPDVFDGLRDKLLTLQLQSRILQLENLKSRAKKSKLMEDLRAYKSLEDDLKPMNPLLFPRISESEWNVKRDELILEMDALYDSMMDKSDLIGAEECLPLISSIKEISLTLTSPTSSPSNSQGRFHLYNEPISDITSVVPDRVYFGFSNQLQEQVVIKVITSTISSIPEVEMYQELQRLRNTTSCVRFYSSSLDTSPRYLVLKKSGVALTHYLSPRLSLKKVIIEQLVDAVDSLHACHIAHNDIKPDNILIEDHRGIVTVRLCDLESAGRFGSVFPFEEGALKYTFPWMSPEVYHGKSGSLIVSPSHDSFAMGLVLAVILDPLTHCNKSSLPEDRIEVERLFKDASNILLSQHLSCETGKQYLTLVHSLCCLKEASRWSMSEAKRELQRLRQTTLHQENVRVTEENRYFKEEVVNRLASQLQTGVGLTTEDLENSFGDLMTALSNEMRVNREEMMNRVCSDENSSREEMLRSLESLDQVQFHHQIESEYEEEEL